MNPIEPPNGFASLSQAAKIAGVTAGCLQRRIRRGQLDAKLIGRCFVIDLGIVSNIQRKPRVDAETKRMRSIWQAIKDRCYSPNATVYSYYGERGIRMCTRWRESFETFMADVGPRPTPDHSIDRIDNDGNYEPANVRWATKDEQSRNRRSNIFIEFQGERLTATDWAKKLGRNVHTVHRRIRDGWTPIAALTVPAKCGGYRPRGYCAERAHQNHV